MLFKSLESITLADLQGLCDHKVMEGVQLDYKEALPGTNDSGKKEFLHDVTALANTDGGDLIYGLRELREEDEKTSIAGEIIGIEGLRFDDVRLWMENLIKDCTELRLTGVGFHPVPVSETHTALVVRVPRSWNGPHAVRVGNHWRFYARNSGGNYSMDVPQLRDAFLARSSLLQRLEEFRDLRVDRLRQTRPDLAPYLVIHLQPFSSAQPGFEVDIRAARSNPEELTPGGDTGPASRMRFNFDGLFVTGREAHKGSIQLFRSGSTEELDTDVLDNTANDRSKYIDALELEKVLFRGVGRRLALLKLLGVTSPMMLHLSLLGVRKFRLLAQAQSHDERLLFDKVFPNVIDRNDLILPGVIIENIQELKLEGIADTKSGEMVYHSERAARPLVRGLLDVVWNSADVERCLTYDADGNWLGYVTRDEVIKYR